MNANASIPCFFKLFSWIRANERVIMANPPRKRGSRAASRGTFTVVVITDDDPLDTPIVVVRNGLRDPSPFTGDLVLGLVRLAVLDVDGTNHAVLRDVLEMTVVLEPRSTSRDVVSSCRANQHATRESKGTVTYCIFH
jgi:hypothetical protein